MSTATQTRQSAAAPPAQSQARNAVVPSNGANPPAVDGDQPKQKSIGQELKDREGQFRAALPAHIPLERFMRVVLTAIQRNPDLAYADRASLFTSAIQAAQDGLLPDGKEGALVIYKTKMKVRGEPDRWIEKVQWMPMVAGILKKVRNSGQLKTIVARVVYAGDKFRNWIDDNGEHIEYEAADDQDRSTVRRVFAMAKLKDDSIVVEVLQPADIEKIRNASKSRDSGPWVQWWDQMAQKSAIRRLSKRLPISTDLDDLIRRDDALYDFEGARQQAEIAQGGTQSIAGRLDALAQIPERRAGSEPGPNDDADDGGEVGSEHQEDASEGSNDSDGSDLGEDASSQPELTPRETLMTRIRSGMTDGVNPLRSINQLSADEDALLSPQDKASLKAEWSRMKRPETVDG